MRTLIRRLSEWFNTSAPPDPARIAMPELRNYPSAAR